MRREIRVVDKERGIVQITSTDERYYTIPSPDGMRFLPSVTFITSYYPKGKFFEAWLKKMGHESEQIKMEAGERGTKVHQAIAALIDGQTVSLTDSFFGENHEDLTADEYSAVCSFASWFGMVKPKVIEHETLVYNEEIGYAGTLDLDCEIEGVPYIIDFKTSKEIYPSHALQLSAYKHTPGKEDRKLAILQVGYPRNKKGYKFTEVEDQFNLFLATHEIFLNEEGNKPIKQIDLPLTVRLNKGEDDG